MGIREYYMVEEPFSWPIFIQLINNSLVETKLEVRIGAYAGGVQTSHHSGPFKDAVLGFLLNVWVKIVDFN